jgi:putative endonuclease
MTARAEGNGDRPAFVYLLRCRGGVLYCGWTYDVEARLAVHRAGKGSRYVRRRLPAEVAAIFEMPDASAARREEARIKKLTRLEKLALVETRRAAPPAVVSKPA